MGEVVLRVLGWEEQGMEVWVEGQQLAFWPVEEQPFYCHLI